MSFKDFPKSSACTMSNLIRTKKQISEVKCLRNSVYLCFNMKKGYSIFKKLELSSTSQECVFLLLSKKNYIYLFHSFDYVEFF